MGTTEMKRVHMGMLLSQPLFLAFAVSSSVQDFTTISPHPSFLPSAIFTSIFCPPPSLMAGHETRRVWGWFFFSPPYRDAEQVLHTLPDTESVARVSGAREAINCQNTQSKTCHPGNPQLTCSDCGG